MEGGKRPNKRKGNGYLDQIEAIKKQRLGDAVVVSEKLKETIVENVAIGEENADGYFERIFSKATPADVLSEYFWFLKQVPKLLNNEMSEVLHEVQKNLRISDLKRDKLDDRVNFTGDQHPLLEALSCKLGYSLLHILAPPTVVCLLCDKPLTRNNKPSQTVVFTQTGPEMATKYIWECRTCRGIFRFKNENVKFETNSRVYYHVDQYGNPDIGFKKYPLGMKIKVTRSSTEVYCTDILLQSYKSELQHSFTSVEGKAESYNELWRSTEKFDFFKMFLKFHPQVGKHFDSKKDKDNGEVDVEDENNDSNVGNKMHELKRKSLSSAFFNFEVYNEMVERNIVEETIFGPKLNPDNNKEALTYKETVENFMKNVDDLRKNELYKHDEGDCSKDCLKRGCGSVAVGDGNWKLTHVICMWNPKKQGPIQDILSLYPNVCTEQPAHASAFCAQHSKIVEELGYPSDLRKFLEKCGANPNSYTKEGKLKVSKVLDQLSEESTQEETTNSAEDSQGIKYFLRNANLANKDNFTLTEDAEDDCRKDIGEVQRLHRRSRGVECVVGGGGVIDYWAPLYKSEGPTQVALIFLNYLRLKLRGKTVEDFRKFFFSFDNICHVDELRLLKNPLALPQPEDRLWLEINKVIGL